MIGTSKTSSPASSSLSTSYLSGAIQTSDNINFKLSKLRKLLIPPMACITSCGKDSKYWLYRALKPTTARLFIAPLDD